MFSRLAMMSIWLVPTVALSGSILWIGPRTAWREMVMASADAEPDASESFLTSVFALDSSADGTTVLGCLRGDGADESPLLVWTSNGPARRVPAAEQLIAQDVFWQAALLPDGRSLLVAGPNSGISRVDLHSGEATLIRSADAPTTVTTLAIAPSGQKFAVGRGADVLVCDVADGKERLQLRGPSSSVSDIAFSADGISMATARGNGEIQLWDNELGELKHVLRAHTGPAIRCRFAGAGHRLVSVGLDGAFRLWNTETAELLWSEPGDGHGLREVVASPDGRTAAVGGFAGIVRIYDLDARCERQTLDQHTRSITALRFISGGALLISAGDEGTIRYWDTAADFAMVGCFEFGSSRY